MKEIRHLKTIKNKRNLNTKWLLLQNDQNADTTLLHSHDEVCFIMNDMQALKYERKEVIITTLSSLKTANLTIDTCVFLVINYKYL